MKVTWSALAEQRATEAMAYIARDRPEAASAWLDELLEKVARLEEFPKRGRMVPEIGRPEYRELIIGSYRVVYFIATTQLVVLTIRHGREEWNQREIFPSGADER